MLGQRFEGNGRKRCLVRCLENNRSGYPVVVRLQPPTCTDSPSITWLEPGESELGVRRRKIVPDGLLVLEELGGHHRTHRVGPDVVGTGIGEAVPVEAGQRLEAAHLQRLSEHIALTRVLTLDLLHGTSVWAEPTQRSARRTYREAPGPTSLDVHPYGDHRRTHHRSRRCRSRTRRLEPTS